MKKSVICWFIIVLLAVNQWGFADPKNSIEWLMAANTKLDILRFLMVAGLVVHLLLPAIAYKPVRLFVESLGLLSMGLVLGSVLFIPYADPLYINMYPLDFVTIFESAIILMLIGATSETRKVIRIRHRKHHPVFNFHIPKPA